MLIPTIITLAISIGFIFLSKYFDTKVKDIYMQKTMLDEMNNQKVSDPTTRAAIMAQAAKETGGFALLSEDLRYSVGGLSNTFQRLKNTSKEDLEAAVKGGASAIGALVYGGSKDSPSYEFGVNQLGNTEPGDGARFRGRGFFQLTGRANYKRAGALNSPEKLLDMGEAAKTAVDFALRYKGDFGDVKAFTKYVNGAFLGLKERGEYFNAYINDPAITKIGAASTTPSGPTPSAIGPTPSAAGAQVAQASSEVSKGQREQLKPTDANVINMDKINNKTVASNQTTVVDKNKGKSVDTLMARAA
jgi:predicted chitinase